MFNAIHQLQFIRRDGSLALLGCNGFDETALNQSKYHLEFISFRPSYLKRPTYPTYPTPLTPIKRPTRLLEDTHPAQTKRIKCPTYPTHPTLKFGDFLRPSVTKTDQRDTHDQVTFKKPFPITKPTNPIHIGSLESISSGYYSDGLSIGMGNIRKWLKSLRLHKYGWVFDCVSYETMFSFDEEHLERLGITQGARTKLANCIAKLTTRYETMKQIELILSQNEMYVPEAIHEMESMVCSPMKPMRINCDKDVGYQLWKVLNIGEFVLCFSFLVLVFFLNRAPKHPTHKYEFEKRQSLIDQQICSGLDKYYTRISFSNFIICESRKTFYAEKRDETFFLL